MVQAALGGVGVLGAGEHLMVGRPGAQRAGERCDGGIAEGRAAPQRRHLLPGFDQPQPGIGRVHIHHVGDLPGQQPVLIERQSPGQADPAGQPAPRGDQVQRGGHRARPGPFDAGCGQAAGLRNVIEERHQEHIVVLLGRHDQKRLPGHWPPGQPRHRAPRPVGPVHQRVRYLAAIHFPAERRPAPAHLRPGEPLLPVHCHPEMLDQGTLARNRTPSGYGTVPRGTTHCTGWLVICAMRS